MKDQQKLKFWLLIAIGISLAILMGQLKEIFFS